MPFLRASRLLRPALLGAVLLSSAAAARATEGQEFVVADDDGYGIADCMKPGMECGRVMADAWCEAHGHGHANTFGLAEDVTGSTKVSATPATPLATSAVVIRCGE